MALGRRGAAVLTAVILCVLGLGPFTGIAQAAHPAGTCIDVEPETSTNDVGDTHSVTATLRFLSGQNCTGAPTTPNGNLDVRFELTGPNDPDGGNTPATDDLACTLHNNDTNCAVQYQGTTTGTDTILGWHDHDADNVVDAEDPQDSVQKTWVTPVQGISIDCDDATGNDDEINAAGVSEVYTCTVTQPDGGDQDTARDPVSGMPVDVENLNGANDPDNSAAAGTADFNNACTTNASGVCQVTITTAENEAGTANLCFWADSDGDTVFAPTGAGNDGGGCASESPGTEDLNLIDVATLAWATGPILDCDDASGDDDESNPTNSPEVYTCTLTTDDGADQDTTRDPVANAAIDWENLNGSNDPDNSAAAGTADQNNACTTSNQGTCQITISATEGEIGPSNVCFWYDSDADTAFDTAGVAADGGGCVAETPVTEDQDTIDVVTKTWTQNFTLDCDDETGDDAQTNPSGQTELYTCTVTQPDGSDTDTLPDPAANVAIDAENLNGANDPDNSAAAGTADFSACTTANNGSCQFALTPSETEGGTANICFWVDGDADNAFTPAGAAFDGLGCSTETAATEDANSVDVVTKSWAFTEGRTIACSQDVSALTGQLVTLSCIVADRNNNVVSGESVTFTTAGVGSFTSATVDTTDASGIVTVQVTSQDGGPQTVTATLTDDISGVEPAEVDECDRAANDPANSVQGVCADSAVVTWTKVPGACLSQGAIIGTDATETITGTEGDDIICALDGDDTINGLGGSDIIFGMGGNDVVAGGDGNDELRGGAGNDLLRGGAGNDDLFGNAGNDTLQGGAGHDLLTGGPGTDTLRGGKGTDRCTDRPSTNPTSGCEA